jgi:biotin synthase
MQEQEILDVAESVFKSGITTVFLQGGQDPQMDEILEKVIPEIKRRFDGNILLCVGERKSELYRKWRSLGADSYIMKFESSSPEVYFEATNSDLSRRLECINDIKQAGFKIGVGNIIGLPGQTLESIAEDILLALRIDPDFISSAPFIPNQGTPFIQFQTGDLDLTLNWMAICRILFENCLIPSVSALEKIRKGGQVMGLNAGANVVTINFTPQHYREKYTIYNKQRFVVSLDHALETANLAGLRPILK